MTRPSGFPRPSEHAPYFARYISHVTSDDIVGQLAAQLPTTRELVFALDPEHRYAPDKWNVKQVLGHVIDTERIMAYRALRISRGDTTPLPGFEQDVLAAGAPHRQQPIAELWEEFEAVRRATLFLFRPLTHDMWTRLGQASGHPTSARALAYIIGGHELFHRDLLQRLYR